MNRKELWRKFMKTGKVSDYLDYKNAKDVEEDMPVFDEEFSEEFAEEMFSEEYDEFPYSEEYKNDYEDGWISDS